MFSHSKQSEYFALAGILVIAIAMRLYTLGSADIWHDEYFTAVFYKERAFYPENFLIYAAILVSQFFLGESEFSFRLPSFLFGIGGIYAVYLLGKQLQSSAVGLIAALILTLLPWHLFHSQYARYYAAIIFFTALTHFLFLRALKNDSFLYLFGAGAAALFSICTHLTGALAPATLWVVSAALYFFPRQLSHGFSRRIVTIVFWSGIATVVLAVPFVYSKLISWTTEPGQFSRSAAQQIYQFYYETAVIILFALYVVWTEFKSSSRFNSVYYGVTIFLPIIFAIVGTFFTSIRGDYAICFVVPCVVAAALAIYSVGRSMTHGRELSLLLLLLLLANAAPRLLSHYTDRLAENAQYATQFLLEHLRSGDRIASFSGGVRYYLEQESIDVERKGLGGPYNAKGKWPKKRLRPDSGRLWIVFDVRRDDLSPVALRWLRETKATLVWRQVSPRLDSQVRGIEIYLVCPSEIYNCDGAQLRVSSR